METYNRDNDKNILHPKLWDEKTTGVQSEEGGRQNHCEEGKVDRINGIPRYEGHDHQVCLGLSLFFSRKIEMARRDRVDFGTITPPDRGRAVDNQNKYPIVPMYGHLNETGVHPSLLRLSQLDGMR